ncbi:TetR/AcrR family transcriptional regulator [Mycobacterium hodleri]|uniref:TetR/AcrR family transcriptional regulator n=1 Tax=Mycolicibacterium hodleri TaxID=49897 RepID=A0A544VW94_9MYCO|nr:TetR/AcrR family transcriptional regulator [Mycolicibacterium hodleri]TQR84247.1 TetR/AcrR family transcriptional regulator [Mycolicibacterium hodleri]
MTSTSGGEGRRGRSIEKRRAMLQAALELFVAQGYELASVDAIAARAGVSKRTVYDHFGDKEMVFAAVLEAVGDRLTATVQVALDRDATATGDLRERLLDFARCIVLEALPSSDYVHFRRLSARRGSWQQDRESASGVGMDLFVRRVEEWAQVGVINTDKPRRAAQHFVALTLQLAFETLERAYPVVSGEVDEILVDGVDVFVRAYQ